MKTEKLNINFSQIINILFHTDSTNLTLKAYIAIARMCHPAN